MLLVLNFKSFVSSRDQDCHDRYACQCHWVDCPAGKSSKKPISIASPPRQPGPDVATCSESVVKSGLSLNGNLTLTSQAVFVDKVHGEGQHNQNDEAICTVQRQSAFDMCEGVVREDSRNASIDAVEISWRILASEDQGS